MDGNAEQRIKHNPSTSTIAIEKSIVKNEEGAARDPTMLWVAAWVLSFIALLICEFATCDFLYKDYSYNYDLGGYFDEYSKHHPLKRDIFLPASLGLFAFVLSWFCEDFCFRITVHSRY